jgi:HK97 family phage major capsid protein
MSSIRQILARREAIRTEMRSIVEAHPTDLPAEQAARFAVLQGEAETLNANESRAGFMAELDRRASGVPLGAAADAGFNNLLEGYSLTRAIAASANLDEGRAGREREVSSELNRRNGASSGFTIPLDAIRYTALERRAILSSGVGAPLIQTDVGPVVDRLRNASIVQRAGATFMPGMVNNLTLPALTASATASWIVDGATVTESDPTIGSIAMTPHTVGALTSYSRNMLLQTSPQIDQMIQMDLARQIGQAIDVAALTGSGSAGQPKGLVNWTGVQTLALGANGGPLTYASIVALMELSANLNADPTAMSFVSNTKVRAAVANMLDTMNRPLGEAIVYQGAPVFYSNSVSSAGTKGTGTGLSSLFVGDWSNLMLPSWGELTIVSNPYGASYSAGGIDVRALMSCDIAPRNPQAFAFISDIVAA